MSMGTRAGTVAIVGLPNVGKSSLLNRFLETKLSIVTASAQTTRERVVGIDTRDGIQIVFVDTPGVVDPAYLLHHSMLEIIERTVADADVVVLLLDATKHPPTLPTPIEERLAASRGSLVVAINKIDRARPGDVEALQRWTVDHFGAAAEEVSVATGEGVDSLRQELGVRLPPSPYLYPDDDISTQSVRFFVSELIRETIFEQYADELPYSSAVEVEEFRETEDPLYIRATIFVERPSQKGILIGRKGRALRELGVAARAKIEDFVQQRVFLDLWIKVLPKWRKRPSDLRRFGFPVPE
ncbi:MAG: GTPase Era [Gemmatimonas sp.]|nr:GTPase Era [Gemmatimonas sp.]